MADSTTYQDFGLARAALQQLPELSPQSKNRFRDITERFELFAANGLGVCSLAGVQQAHVEAFVWAKSPGYIEPSTPTMHLRRSSIRLLFRVARQLELCEHDPTLDLALPPRTSSRSRPLTDDEMALCRSFSIASLTETRLPAALALAEATATTAELPHITTDDLDLEQRRVWIHGGGKTAARWGQLSEWGAIQLPRRSRAVRSGRLIYRSNGSDESKQVSCCIAIADTLRRAGLGKEPDVRPMSVVAWAGLQIHLATSSIEDVAERLGMRSLDRAAAFISYEWKQ